MPLTLFLVRHGETLFNRRGLMQGWVDSPLTEAGVEQARHAAEQLRDRPLVAAYSSTSGGPSTPPSTSSSRTARFT
jgi:broad specificity phosphatase PhoE